MRILWPCLLALTLVACAGTRAGAQLSDGAHLLTPAQSAAMLERLAEIEQRSTVQIVVVTVPSLGGTATLVSRVRSVSPLVVEALGVIE